MWGDDGGVMDLITARAPSSAADAMELGRSGWRRFQMPSTSLMRRSVPATTEMYSMGWSAVRHGAVVAIVFL